MARWVLHVDLDQFIAAVEVLRHPELRGRPVVVGGDGDPTKRGVVSTASYEAREHGVHSGLPLRTAARRLPEAVFLPVDREAYEEVSETVMAVLRSSGAAVEVQGWDEAFVGVDVEDPEAFAWSLAARVRAETQLDCTVLGQRTQVVLAQQQQTAADELRECRIIDVRGVGCMGVGRDVAEVSIDRRRDRRVNARRWATRHCRSWR